MPTSPTRGDPEAAHDDGCQASDRGAFMRWYVDRFPKLCAYAIHLGAGQDAEDIVHDILARWLVSLNDGDPDNLPADSYWYTAIKNAARNLTFHESVVRRWLAWQPQGEPATWWGPDAVIEARELAATVNNVLGALPPATREAFHLVKELGMSYEAAAKELGTTIKAARRRVERAVAAIRSEIARDTAPFGCQDPVFCTTRYESPAPWLM